MLSIFNSKNSMVEGDCFVDGRLAIKKILVTLAVTAIAVLSPAMSQADEMRPIKDFPSVQLESKERGTAAIRAQGTRMPETEFASGQVESHHRGEAAIRALGNRLPEVAKWYLKTPQEFQDILRNDPSARIDNNGRMYFVEAAPSVNGGVTSAVGGLYPAAQTFLFTADLARKE